MGEQYSKQDWQGVGQVTEEWACREGYCLPHKWERKEVTQQTLIVHLLGAIVPTRDIAKYIQTPVGEDVREEMG